MTVTSGASADKALEGRSTDSRLQRAFRLVAGDEVRTLSLDVFDTMLWRRVPEPVDAFPLVGLRLEEQGRLRADLAPQEFAMLRRAAEARARAKRDAAGGGAEVTLGDIYAELPPSAVPDLTPAELARIEIEVEKELLAPDLD